MVNTTAGKVRVLSSTELLESNEWQGMHVQDLAVGETLPVPGAEYLLGGTTARASFWRHDGGTLPYARPSSSELIYVVHGKVEISSGEGSSVIVTQGDAAFIPQGFVGSWTSLLPVLKLSISVQSPSLE
jgi:uncharacterized cupin superfamily protein